MSLAAHCYAGIVSIRRVVRAHAHGGDVGRLCVFVQCGHCTADGAVMQQTMWAETSCVHVCQQLYLPPPAHLVRFGVC